MAGYYDRELQERNQRRANTIAIVGVTALLAFTFGRDWGEDHTWEEAERRAVQVQLRGFCAAADTALSAILATPSLSDEEDRDVANVIAGEILFDARTRLPLNLIHSTSRDRPLQHVATMCRAPSQPLLEMGVPLTELAGIEPSSLAP